MKSYETTVKVQPHEVVMTLDPITGELKEHTIKRRNNLPQGKQPMNKKALFKKDYENSWNFLWKVLTPVEYKIAHRLANMSEINTNSLKPLDDTTSKIQLSKEFNIHRNHIGRIFKKLFDLGVYGRFEVAKPHLPHGKYWIVNPYLSFAGKLIHSDVANLFKDTIIHMAFSEMDEDLILSKCIKMGIKLP
jgi:hypothetical protein